MAALDFPAGTATGQTYDRYVWDNDVSVWNLNLPEANAVYSFQYLVIAGGGCGNTASNDRGGGGGGAGGYRSSVSGESSGGGVSAETPLNLLQNTYSVTVGAGGAPGSNGSPSTFANVISIGGGAGSGVLLAERTGGSGGGAADGGGQTGFAGLYAQGYKGGDTPGTVGGAGGAGGGGAGSVGANGTTSNTGGAGGAGVSSSITGSAVTRAVGGQGGTRLASGSGASGAANTGSGGEGTDQNRTVGSGGSGVVIVKYPSNATLTIGAGLTASTSTVGAYKVTTFTAGSDTITIN